MMLEDIDASDLEIRYSALIDRAEDIIGKREDDIARLRKDIARLAWTRDTHRSLRALVLGVLRTDRINPELYYLDRIQDLDGRLEAWCEQAWSRAHPENPA